MSIYVKYILIAFLTITPCLLKSQQVEPSLKELIDSALRHDYNLANQQLDIQLTNIDRRKIRDAYLPRVNVSVTDAFLLSSFKIKSSEVKIPQLDIDIKRGSNTYTVTSNILQSGVSGTALLYSGGKIPNLSKALEQKSNAQTALMEKDRQEIISDIATTYDQLALLAEIRLVLNESERRLAENIKTADKQLSYGLITKYEHQKIEVAQAQLASKILEYEGKRDLVIEKLFLLTTISKERLLLIENKLQLLETRQLEGRIENRAEIKALNASILAGTYKIKAEKTWIVPKIGAATSFGYFGFLAGHIKSSDPLSVGGNKLSSSLPNLNMFPVFTLGVNARWTLFDGREGKYDVQKAKIEVQKLENDKKDALEKLELNLAKCYTDYDVAKSQVIVKTTQQQTAQNALTQATKEYRTGLIKSSQLIDAEEDFQQAAFSYVQAVYDQRRAAMNLLKATGNLTVYLIQ